MPTARCWKARPKATWCCWIPGRARCARVYGDHQRFIDTYFRTYPGIYFTGDGCRRDADGYYWITGRVDDVINVSGHRIGTAEVESALVLASGGRRSRGGRLPARHQGPGHLRLRHAERRASSRSRRAAQGAGRAGAQGDRPDRHARPPAVGAGPAEDALAARSCGASCARSPRTRPTSSATLDAGRSVGRESLVTNAGRGGSA